MLCMHVIDTSGLFAAIIQTYARSNKVPLEDVSIVLEDANSNVEVGRLDNKNNSCINWQMAGP